MPRYDNIVVVKTRGELVDGILGLVRPLVLNSARVVEHRISNEGWTVGMRAVALVLDRMGPTRVPAIANVMDLSRQAVQRHVNELIALGHASTQANPRHQRSVLIQLTETGRQALARIRQLELDEMASLVPECDDTALRITYEVLTALHRDVRALARSDSDKSHGDP